MARWLPVPLEELERTGRTVVRVDGHEIAVFASGGDVYALENACPHAGNPLIEGEVADRVLTCVYHLWRFDLATGECLRGEAPARAYRTEVRNGELWLELPD